MEEVEEEEEEEKEKKEVGEVEMQMKEGERKREVVHPSPLAPHLWMKGVGLHICHLQYTDSRHLSRHACHVHYVVLHGKSYTHTNSPYQQHTNNKERSTNKHNIFLTLTNKY